MNVVKIMYEDMVDSVDGIAISVWYSGCDIRCKGCHNQLIWDPIPSEQTNEELAGDIVKNLLDSHIKGLDKSLSILGGEPLAPCNRNDVRELLWEIRRVFPKEYLTIRLWTGRTKEQILAESEEDSGLTTILGMVDEVIVGPFIEELKQDLPLRGSSNQKILKNGVDYKIWMKPFLTFLNTGKETQL